MKIVTKYFGEIDSDEDQIITFPHGLYGFEEERRFVLLPFAGNGTLFSLQSVDNPYLAFVVMDPFALDETYAPVLQKDELKELDADRSEDLYYYVMCVVREPVEDSTVNLKCPIAINSDSLMAMHVILEEDTYQMRHRITEFGMREGDAIC